ncbi:TPA: DUF2304 domain-containing protein [bacterium]|nr:DUF2304 domain-containing protein [bacterium]
MEYHPTIQTTIFISLFLVVYLVVLLKNTIKNAIDLYDFLLLSSVAIIPSIFVLFPKFSEFLARLFGVAFPFVVLFSLLLLIIFVYLYRLVVKINNLNNKNILLIQELALLSKKILEKKNNE